MKAKLSNISQSNDKALPQREYVVFYFFLIREKFNKG